MCRSAEERICVLALGQARLEVVTTETLPRSEVTLSEEILWQETLLPESAFEETLIFRGCCWTSSLWVVVGSVIWASLLAGLTVDCSSYLSRQAQKRIFWQVVVVIDLCLCCSLHWSRQVRARTFWQAVETFVFPWSSLYLSRQVLD